MSFTDEQIRAMVGAVRVWYHIIPLGPGIVTPGINDPRMTL